MKPKYKERVVRFGVSLEKSLLGQLDAFCSDRGLPNRSQALRTLLREYMVDQECSGAKDIAGTVTIVYDHHLQSLVRKLVSIQHDYHEIIVSSQHVHVDHNNCIEVVIVKGKAVKARELCRELRSVKGLKHVALNTTTNGSGIV